MNEYRLVMETVPEQARALYWELEELKEHAFGAVITVGAGVFSDGVLVDGIEQFVNGQTALGALETALSAIGFAGACYVNKFTKEKAKQYRSYAKNNSEEDC